MCSVDPLGAGFMKRAIAAVAAVFLFIAIAPPANAASTFWLTVKVALDQDSADRVIADTKPQAVALCASGIENQYGIRKGSPIKVLNERGAIVGLTKVTKINVTYIGPSVNDKPLWTCNYTGRVKVDNAKKYKVSIGGVKGPGYSYQDLKDRRFRLDLIL
jgi:hypothetical protein